MKRLIFNLLFIFFVLCLTGCRNDNLTNQTNKFIGTIMATHSNMIVVKPNKEFKEFSDSNELIIKIPNEEKYQLGSIVKITYVNGIKESNPAQIDATKIEIIDLGDFNANKKSNVEIINNEASLTIKKGTLTNKGATLVLKNKSSKNFQYGEPYSIEVKKDGEWYSIDIFRNFIMPAYELNVGETKEIEINWEEGYGKLPAGTYRILKNIDYKKSTGKNESFFLSAEFTID